MLVMCHEDAFVAQIGPTALYAILGDHIQRYPLRSPWLDEAMNAHLEGKLSALGFSKFVEPHLQHLGVSPQDIFVLADSRLAGQLPLREVVQAVDTPNMKTVLNNLGKVAQAHHCSALAVEVVEDTSSTDGPLKIAAPPQLTNLLQRRRPEPEPADSSPTQPVPAEAVAETSAEEPVLEAASEMAAHSVAAAPRSSILSTPLSWLSPLKRKAEPVDEHETIFEDEGNFDDTADPDLEYDYEVEVEPDEMASMAPGSTFGRVDHQQASRRSSSLGRLFGWFGIAFLTFVAFLGGALKSVFSFILPGTDNDVPRQAGMQAQQQASGSTWKILRNVAIAIPLLVALLVTVSYLQKGRIRDAEYNEYIATAQSKFEQAQAVEDFGSATGLMAEAEAALVQAEQIRTDQPEISQLRQQMAEVTDEKSNVQRLYYLPQLRQYTDEGTDLKGLVVQGVEVYVLDEGNDRIFHHRLDDQGEALLPDDELLMVTSRGEIVEEVTVSDLLGMTWMPAGGNRQTSDLMILNSTGLLEYNPNWGVTTSALAGGETLALPNAVASFFGNFYVLDPQANKLLRYRPTQDGYSAPPESYFPEGVAVDLTNAVDLAIDGAVYVLYQDGHIAKFLSGQPDNFEVTGLDLRFNNPVAIFTAPDEEVQHIYVADAGNQRIVQLNKDGSFVRQFKPRPGETVSFANLQDLFVDEIGGRLYILDSNNLHLTNLPSALDDNTPATQ
jgi:hypothetical protein